MVKSLRSWVTEIPTDFQTRCRGKKAFQLRGAFSRCLPTGRARIPRGPAFPALNGATLGRRRRRNGSGHLVFFRHFSLGGRCFFFEFSARRRKKKVFFLLAKMSWDRVRAKNRINNGGILVNAFYSRVKSGFLPVRAGGVLKTETAIPFWRESGFPL